MIETRGTTDLTNFLFQIDWVQHHHIRVGTDNGSGASVTELNNGFQISVPSLALFDILESPRRL